MAAVVGIDGIAQADRPDLFWTCQALSSQSAVVIYHGLLLAVLIADMT
jgi:hypothetical protein